MKSYEEILRQKIEYYGKTEVAYEFAAEEYATRKIIQENYKILEYAKMENNEGLKRKMYEEIHELELTIKSSTKNDLKKFNVNKPMYIQITQKGWKHLKNTIGDEYIEHSIMPYRKVINNKVWFKLQCYEVFDLLPTRVGSPPLFNTNVMLDMGDIE